MKWKVVREVDADALVAKATEDAIKSAFFAMLEAVQNRAPTRDRILVNGLGLGGGVSQLSETGAVVGTDVEYGYPLDKPETREPHYVRHKSYAGEKTANWFDKGVEDADLSEAESIMRETVENGWRA